MTSKKPTRGSFLVSVKAHLVLAVRHEQFSFMNVHVISKARWTYNPLAVTGEFSLASSPCRFTPNDDREQLLWWCLEIFEKKQKKPRAWQGCLVESFQFVVRFLARSLKTVSLIFNLFFYWLDLLPFGVRTAGDLSCHCRVDEEWQGIIILSILNKSQPLK